MLDQRTAVGRNIHDRTCAISTTRGIPGDLIDERRTHDDAIGDGSEPAYVLGRAARSTLRARGQRIERSDPARRLGLGLGELGWWTIFVAMPALFASLRQPDPGIGLALLGGGTLVVIGSALVRR